MCALTSQAGGVEASAEALQTATTGTGVQLSWGLQAGSRAANLDHDVLSDTASDAASIMRLASIIVCRDGGHGGDRTRDGGFGGGYGRFDEPGGGGQWRSGAPAVAAPAADSASAAAQEPLSERASLTVTL